MKKFFIFFVFLICFLPELSAAKENSHSQSLSIQFGINGVNNDANSYALQFIPPDLSYSHELFDNNVFNISAAVFYDNVGVKVKDTNFSYRLGARVDFGMELGRYLPYITLGQASIKNAHHYQSSPVCGVGFLTRMSENWMLVNEVNFQNVRYQNSDLNVVNLTVGLTYGF